MDPAGRPRKRVFDQLTTNDAVDRMDVDGVRSNDVLMGPDSDDEPLLKKPRIKQLKTTNDDLLQGQNQARKVKTDIHFNKNNFDFSFTVTIEKEAKIADLYKEIDDKIKKFWNSWKVLIESDRVKTEYYRTKNLEVVSPEGRGTTIDLRECKLDDDIRKLADTRLAGLGPDHQGIPYLNLCLAMPNKVELANKAGKGKKAVAKTELAEEVEDIQGLKQRVTGLESSVSKLAQSLKRTSISVQPGELRTADDVS